jgi:hypothetical protein
LLLVLKKLAPTLIHDLGNTQRPSRVKQNMFKNCLENRIPEGSLDVYFQPVDEVTGQLRGVARSTRGAHQRDLLKYCALIAIYMVSINPSNAANCKYDFHPARRPDKTNKTQSVTVAPGVQTSTGVTASSNESEHMKDARKLLSSAEDELRDINDLLKIAKTCGPAGLMGRETFGGWQMIFPWSPLRTGTMCKQVSFKTTFPNEHDILIFLA